MLGLAGGGKIIFVLKYNYRMGVVLKVLARQNIRYKKIKSGCLKINGNP